MTYLYAYLSTLIVFLLCDMAWLGTMASRLYRPTLGDILSAEVNLPPAIVFYLVYPVGLVVFAEFPDVWVWTGGAVIIGAAVLLTRGETRSEAKGG